MELTVKQVSSLHKIRSIDSLDMPRLENKTCLAVNCPNLCGQHKKEPPV